MVKNVTQTACECGRQVSLAVNIEIELLSWHIIDHIYWLPREPTVMNSKRYFVLATLVLMAIVSLIGCNRQDRSAMRENGMNNDQLDKAVRAVLDEQVQAWNRGDIDGFMMGYAKSDKTTFISGDTLTRGWQTVLDRYKKSYDSREKMGTLAFTELEVKPLSDDSAVANGRWQLTRAGDTPHGRFTLIFRRTAEGWRIVHDHTSSAGS
jgi:ketosteroid isomerase-like protein